METVLEVVGPRGDKVTLAGADTGKDGMWLDSEFTGFFDPEVEVVAKPYANRAGQEFISHRTIERRIVFRVSIENGVGERSWHKQDARWRRLWSYSDYTEIKITTDDGTRTLKARLEKIEVDTTYDPHVNEATQVVMTVVADDPFWYGADLVKDVVVSGSATITVDEANPTGNVIFPIWALEGPGTWTVPDPTGGGQFRYVQMPDLSSGVSMVVNQDPAKRQVEDSSNSLIWARMNGVRFEGAIAPWTGKLSFVISVSGASSPRQARLILKRPFDRPWGGV